MYHESITELLKRWQAGDKAAERQFLEAVYAELREMARAYRRRTLEQSSQQTTELVNELYLKISGSVASIDWESRKHFFVVAARQLRRLLVDEAREKKSAKRGGGVPDLGLDMALLPHAGVDTSIVALEAALRELEKLSPVQVRIIELRFYAGLKQEEVAEILGICPMTQRRHFNAAKTWLGYRLRRGRRE